MDKIIDGIYVKTLGKDTNQAIVFIHGFPYDHTLWDDVIEEFKNDYYCISYDIRGFGKSEVNTAQFTMQSYVQDLENIISDLKLNKPIICGFSMGGYITLRANEREKYKALILANTATNSDDDKAKLKRSTAISDIDTKGVEPFIDGFLSAAFSEDFIKKEPLKIKHIKENILSFDPLGIKAALLAMMSRTDTSKGLEEADIPVLLITGDDDKIIPKETMELMASKIKDSTFVSLSRSGHMSMLEDPDGFKNAMRSFLAGL